MNLPEGPIDEPLPTTMLNVRVKRLSMIITITVAVAVVGGLALGSAYNRRLQQKEHEAHVFQREALSKSRSNRQSHVDMYAQQVSHLKEEISELKQKTGDEAYSPELEALNKQLEEQESNHAEHQAILEDLDRRIQEFSVLHDCCNP